MVNNRAVHGAQNSIGYICGSGNLQEVPTRVNQIKSPGRQTKGVEEPRMLSMRELSFGSEVGVEIRQPSAQVSPIVAVHVSACLDGTEDAIHLSVQAVFHLSVPSSILVWLDVHQPLA
jgi:hypothetical protein